MFVIAVNSCGDPVAGDYSSATIDGPSGSPRYSYGRILYHQPQFFFKVNVSV